MGTDLADEKQLVTAGSGAVGLLRVACAAQQPQVRWVVLAGFADRPQRPRDDVIDLARSWVERVTPNHLTAANLAASAVTLDDVSAATKVSVVVATALLASVVPLLAVSAALQPRLCPHDLAAVLAGLVDLQ